MERLRRSVISSAAPLCKYSRAIGDILASAAASKSETETSGNFARLLGMAQFE